MRVTTFSDYTLRVLMYLALKPDERVTIQEVARAYGISENHLMKVVHHLARNGTVETTRGKGGGMRLAHPAEAILLGEVLRDSEERSPALDCLNDPGINCQIQSLCRVPAILQRAFDILYAELNRYSLADLVKQPEEFRQILMKETLEVQQKTSNSCLNGV